MRTITLFIFSFTCCLTTVFAQEEDSMTYTWNNDSLEYLQEGDSPMLLEQEQHQYKKDSVQGKALDSLTWKKLTKDLNYNDTLQIEQEEQQAVHESDSWSLPSFGMNSVVTKYILFAVVIAVLLYLLYRLIGSAIFTSHTTIKKSNATFEILHDDEQMMQKDLNSLLAEAINKKDYKTAIRILFIQSLQDLQTLEWIKWQKEKTNRDYLTELTGKDVFLAFGSMVLLYEKAWYSESVTTQEDLEAFTHFKLHIRRP